MTVEQRNKARTRIARRQRARIAYGVTLPAYMEMLKTALDKGCYDFIVHEETAVKEIMKTLRRVAVRQGDA